MHTNKFYNVLDELINVVTEISNNENHLAFTEGYGIYGGINRKDVIKSLEKNKEKQNLLKNKLINLYNNTLSV